MVKLKQSDGSCPPSWGLHHCEDWLSRYYGAYQSIAVVAKAATLKTLLRVGEYGLYALFRVCESISVHQRVRG